VARTAAAAATTKALSAKAHRGHYGAQTIAFQASHGPANECGLCALKNVTVSDSTTLDETIGIARGLEKKLVDEAVRLGAAHKVHHLDADILRTRTRDGRGHSTRRASGRDVDADADTPWMRTPCRRGREADAA
jgi:hypothetical protein